jgi:hypothetical protein
MEDFCIDILGPKEWLSIGVSGWWECFLIEELVYTYRGMELKSNWEAQDTISAPLRLLPAFSTLQNMALSIWRLDQFHPHTLCDVSEPNFFLFFLPLNCTHFDLIIVHFSPNEESTTV